MSNFSLPWQEKVEGREEDVLNLIPEVTGEKKKAVVGKLDSLDI